MKAFLILYIPVFLVTTIPFQIYGQNKSINDAQENISKIGGVDASIGVVRAYDARYEGVKGSPFYFENWSSGSIELENGKNIQNLQLKFNVYENELILNQSGAFYLQKKDIKSFTIQDKTSGKSVSFIKLPHPKKEATFSFYKLLYHGKIDLIEYIKVIFEKANYEGGYSNDKRYDEFKKYPEIYYFSTTIDKPIKIKPSASGFSKIFPNRKDVMKKYILDQSLDCSIEQDQIRIMEYYNQIQ